MNEREAAPAGPVTRAAKLGSVILVVFGVLLAAGGIFLLTESPRDMLPGIPVIAAFQVLVGVFAWQGRVWARILGVVYGFVLGILALMALAMGSTLGTQSTAIALLTLAFSAGYLYTALAFIFAWDRQPRG